MKKKILFIGDSITEDGRLDDEKDIGLGYVRIINDHLQDESINTTVINKGISGNRISDLAKRWNTDVLTENPDIVSISIGINDVWRQLDSPTMEQITPKKFKAIYLELLNQVQAKTNATIVLMEPTIIKESTTSKGNKMLKPYVKIIRKLSKKYNAILIPLHTEFIHFIKNNPNTPLTTDGVHMNQAGRILMAVTWLDTMRKELALP